MNKLIITSAVCAAVGLASPAFAGSKRYDRYDRGYGYERGDYAEVLEAEPITRQVRVSQPRQECWDEEVVYQDHRRHHDAAGGAILGAVLGGVIGHQFGGGSGRDAATAVGAVIGAGVGANEARYHSRARGDRVGYEERCQVVDDYRYEERVEGYDVTYRYGGHIYHTRMPYDPGRRMPVNVDVAPSRY